MPYNYYYLKIVINEQQLEDIIINNTVKYTNVFFSFFFLKLTLMLMCFLFKLRWLKGIGRVRVLGSSSIQFSCFSLLVPMLASCRTYWCQEAAHVV